MHIITACSLAFGLMLVFVVLCGLLALGSLTFSTDTNRYSNLSDVAHICQWHKICSLQR